MKKKVVFFLGALSLLEGGLCYGQDLDLQLLDLGKEGVYGNLKITPPEYEKMKIEFFNLLKNYKKGEELSPCYCNNIEHTIIGNHFNNLFFKCEENGDFDGLNSQQMIAWIESFSCCALKTVRGGNKVESDKTQLPYVQKLGKKKETCNQKDTKIELDWIF